MAWIVANVVQESRVTSVGVTANAVVMGVAGAVVLNTVTEVVPLFASTMAMGVPPEPAGIPSCEH